MPLMLNIAPLLFKHLDKGAAASLPISVSRFLTALLGHRYIIMQVKYL